MFTLYYAPQTCALASHLALEHVGAEYQALRVDFSRNEQRSAEYLHVNPKGRVPALVTSRGILTETSAILQFVCQSYLAARLAPGQRLLGLDLCTKTIGLALSDVSRTIASALSTIERRKFMLDAGALLAIAAEHEVGALVIGLPINLDGSEGPRAQSTRAFVRNLAPLTGLPMVLWYERMSTQAAERTLLAADTSRRRRAQVIDKMAAAFILQGCLDRLRRIGADGVL